MRIDSERAMSFLADTCEQRGVPYRGVVKLQTIVARLIKDFDKEAESVGG